MAFSVEISGLTFDGKYPAWKMEVPWWDGLKLRDDQRFRDVSQDLGYYDYEAILIAKEARELAEKYRPKAMLWMEKSVEDLDQKLAAINGPNERVRVFVFEWESGL